MTVNYIVNGFDKDFYNFDAVVVPVAEMISDKSEQEVYGFRLQFLNDFCHDFVEIMQGLPISAFKPDGVTAVRSEKTGIYYIFVLVRSHDYMPRRTMNRRTREIYHNRNYSYCCEKMVRYINNLDVKNILVHPAFNQVNFNSNKDSDFLEKTLKSNIDRFSRKNIYIFVEELNKKEQKIENSILLMEKGRITYEECKRIFVEKQMENSYSYTNSLIRIAEIETRYKPKTIAEQFREDMNNNSCFFDEYINRYPGTATELAEAADIDKSTVSTIKNHKYKAKSKKVILALAIALNLTVDDRKRFINSAGFNYPHDKYDYFIEQQLRKKIYTSVIDFNNDIINEYPEFIIETRSFKGCGKSDK
jgi:transcriptional regulator with XRE-family HTH domain